MTKGFTHESATNATVEHYTPAWIFELLGLQFDLDPCHPEGDRLPWVPAGSVYTKADNGLVKPWFGRVWLNPPYGPETPRWLELMHERREGVGLFFARTDTGWFHDFVRQANGVLFLNKRVQFVGRDGKPRLYLDKRTNKMRPGSPGSGSMLVAWGRECRSTLIEASIAKGAGTFADLS